MSQTPLDVGIVGWHSHNEMFDEISVDLRKAGHRITRYAHRDAFTEIQDKGGTFRALNPPFRFSDAEARAKPFVAALGEHTEAVLAEAGFTQAEIAALTPPP